MKNHHFSYCARFMCILSACEWLHFLSKKTPNEPQDDWKMAIADCTCRARVSNIHYEPPYAPRRWVFATKCSYTAVFRCIYYRHVHGVFFYQIRKIDGSPSVLHLFRRYWMILKAMRLAYTRKVIYKNVVESFGEKKIPGNDFLFRYFWWWWGMQKTFPGILISPKISTTSLHFILRV